MKLFRRSSGFTAILAITAWANIQVMACCWSFSDSHKIVANVVIAPGHECCHKEYRREVAVVVVPISDAVAGLHEHNGTCGLQQVTPALQSQAPVLGSILIADIQLTNGNYSTPSAFLSETPVGNTGPPRYLALQRFLI